MSVGRPTRPARRQLLTVAEGSANGTWFNLYHAYRDHLHWLADVAVQFRDNAEVVTSSKSLQGNAITGIHIFGGGGKGARVDRLHGWLPEPVPAPASDAGRWSSTLRGRF